MLPNIRPMNINRNFAKLYILAAIRLSSWLAVCGYQSPHFVLRQSSVKIKKQIFDFLGVVSVYLVVHNFMRVMWPNYFVGRRAYTGACMVVFATAFANMNL